MVAIEEIVRLSITVGHVHRWWQDDPNRNLGIIRVLFHAKSSCDFRVRWKFQKSEETLVTRFIAE